MKLTRPLVCASASPRRHELLRRLGLDFEVYRTDVPEVLPEGYDPARAPEYLARLKLAATEARQDAGELVLAADSVVLLGDDLLGKPTDLDDARATLRRLCGARHEVVTGYALGWADPSTRRRRIHSRAVSTYVTLAPATEREIDYYLAREAPLDRAGSYGVQDWIGVAKATRLEGSYTNVMGLPTQELWADLVRLGFAGVGERAAG